MLSDGEKIGKFFEFNNLSFDKCLEPGMSCKNPAIRAHSIQNARIFDLLVEDGHVIGTRLGVKNGAPDVTFARISRSNASTFTGMCAEHDANIFRALDTNEFNEADEEQLFLLAYRSVTRELHACMRGAVQMQVGYRDRVDRGLDPDHVPTPAGIVAVQQMMKAHETFSYRAKAFDIPMLKWSLGEIQHDVFTLEHLTPTIAVSAMFSLPKIEVNGELVRCTLNVLPVSNKQTKVVFSYIPGDSDECRKFLHPILSSNADVQKFELSRLILRRVENFFLSPKFYASWEAQKKDAVLEAFQSTILNENDVSRKPELMLF